MKQPKNEVRKKTIHYILVYFICLLLAVCVWLVVMFDDKKDLTETEESSQTAEASFDLSCSI